MQVMSTEQETYVPFPLCVKVLIGVYDKIHLHEKYWIYEWNKKSKTTRTIKTVWC